MPSFLAVFSRATARVGPVAGTGCEVRSRIHPKPHSVFDVFRVNTLSRVCRNTHGFSFPLRVLLWTVSFPHWASSLCDFGCIHDSTSESMRCLGAARSDGSTTTMTTKTRVRGSHRSSNDRRLASERWLRCANERTPRTRRHKGIARRCLTVQILIHVM